MNIVRPSRPQIQARAPAHLLRHAVHRLTDVAADLQQLPDEVDLDGLGATEGLFLAALLRDVAAEVDKWERRLVARRGEPLAVLSNVTSLHRDGSAS